MTVRPAPRRRIAAIAAAICLLAFIYRFNALSGAGGGFDDQHFLYLVHAKEVLAGGQPLRDFLDAGLQGARPSLSYELPALAQRVLGADLRSEAVLTVGGVAIAAAATAAAASRLTAWPWAMVATVLSIWISPKLYSYPKVLALSVMAWLVVEYALRPAWRGVLMMAAWTAIAFLFRHDLAVYCGIAGAIVIALAHGSRVMTTAGRGLAYAAVTAVLLAPSVWWIERYAGVAEYLRNAMEMSAREADRTDILWPVPSFDGVATVAAAFAVEANTEAWLYYVFLAIPVITVASVAIGWRRQRRLDAADPALLALAVMTLMLSFVYLRGSLEARFGDMAPPVAVLGAVLLARGLGVGAAVGVRAPLRRAAAGAVTLVVLAVTGASIWHLQSVGTELAITGLSASPVAVVRRSLHVSSELSRLPAAVWAEPGDRRTQIAVQYLNRCTAPSDRVLMLAFAPDVLAFADRRFAGGRWSFIPGFYMDERYSTYAIQRLEAERVPLALAEPEGFYEEFPGLATYVRDRFAEVGTLTLDGDRTLRILADRNRRWHPYGPAGWPCFT